MTVGGELKNLREGRGLSQNKLAAQAGVSAAAISRWEAGLRVPAMPELEAVLTTLEASDAQKRTILRLINAPRALLHLRALDKTGIEAHVSGGRGDLLWAMRKRKGWTQAETARAVHVTQTQIARWERGEAWPDSQKLHAFCWALDAHPEEAAELSRHSDSAKQGSFAQDKESGRSDWSEQDWIIYIGFLMNYPPPEALADLFHIGIEQHLAQLARLHPFAIRLLSDAYAAHARFWMNRNQHRQASHWAECGFALLRQEKHAITRRADPNQLWFGNIMALASRSSQSQRPAGLRRAAQTLRDWLPALLFQEKYTGKASAHYAWGQTQLATTLLRMGQKSSALDLGKEACQNAERFHFIEGFLRWRDYANLQRQAGQPARALDTLAHSQAMMLGESVRPATIARHYLMEAECLIALSDMSGAKERAYKAEQLIKMKNVESLQAALRGVTSAL